MTKYTISNAMIEAATKTWCDVVTVSYGYDHSYKRRMKSSLEAALEVMEKEQDDVMKTFVDDVERFKDTSIRLKTFSTYSSYQALKASSHPNSNKEPSSHSDTSKPDTEGWIEHIGNECPVDGDTIVNWRTTVDTEWDTDNVSFAGRLDWGSDLRYGRITHYRIVKPAENPLKTDYPRLYINGERFQDNSMWTYSGAILSLAWKPSSHEILNLHYKDDNNILHIERFQGNGIDTLFTTAPSQLPAIEKDDKCHCTHPTNCWEGLPNHCGACRGRIVKPAAEKPKYPTFDGVEWHKCTKPILDGKCDCSDGKEEKLTSTFSINDLPSGRCGDVHGLREDGTTGWVKLKPSIIKVTEEKPEAKKQTLLEFMVQYRVGSSAAVHPDQWQMEVISAYFEHLGLNK